MGKKTNIPNLLVSLIFGWSRNPYGCQNMGKVDFHSTGKVRKNKHFKFMGFLNSLG